MTQAGSEGTDSKPTSGNIDIESHIQKLREHDGAERNLSDGEDSDDLKPEIERYCRIYNPKYSGLT